MNYIQLYGGRNAPEQVAEIKRNGWPQWSGMSGRIQAEYPRTIKWLLGLTHLIVTTHITHMYPLY